MGVFNCKLRKDGAFEGWIKELFISLIYLCQKKTNFSVLMSVKTSLLHLKVDE